MRDRHAGVISSQPENGPEFMSDLVDGEPARVVLSVLPAHPENDWADLLAVALVACAVGGEHYMSSRRMITYAYQRRL